MSNTGNLADDEMMKLAANAIEQAGNNLPVETVEKIIGWAANVRLNAMLLEMAIAGEIGILWNEDAGEVQIAANEKTVALALDVLNDARGSGIVH